MFKFFISLFKLAFEKFCHPSMMELFFMVHIGITLEDFPGNLGVFYFSTKVEIFNWY